MPKVRIQIFEAGALSATINLPAWIVAGTTRLLPETAGAGLQERIDLAHIAELLKRPNGGQLFEIEDHAANDKIVISMIGDDDQES